MGKSTLKLKKGEIIKTEQFDDKYLLVLDGYLSLNLGDHIPIQYYSQKHILILENLSRDLFYVAKTDVQLLALDKSIIKPNFLKANDVEFAHYHSLYMSSEERVKFNLYYLGERLGTKTDSGIELPAFLNQNEFASYCNISRVFLNSLLKNLKQENVLLSTKRPWLIRPQEVDSELLVKN
ncbi:Crp/Fnr family transcriptional regulator [Listeria sp. PSOL-1]|uniref:Crp/Fnr family transcriptional regulator n=1 Tax=Listeria sp. PSOL-1 TaxID=1844999 RepID=UPI0013D42B67|nr:Crp/Fnr family transcriptional regulator [Listeria sp. PSOL-1]